MYPRRQRTRSRRRLHRQPPAPFGLTPPQNVAATGCTDPLQEAVSLLPAVRLRLVCAFRHVPSPAFGGTASTI